VAGTIAWAGGAPSAGFMGYNGSGWVPLDVQWDGDWIMAPGMTGMPTIFNVNPGPVAVSTPGYVPPIAPNQYAFLYVNNNNAGQGIFTHQLLLDDVTGNLNASQGFLITNPAQPGLSLQFSQGIFNADASYKVTKGGTLAATFQGDGVTMVRYNPSGITDIPNQSRVRAYQTDPGNIGQLILPNVWTPVNFNNDAPLSSGYDQQNEYTVIANIQAQAPPENAFFVAISAGYYQVNARSEFNVTEYFEQQGGWNNVIVMNGDYVSIAIYSGAAPGQTTPYAIGNNLQIGYNSPVPVENKLWHNNAPNVSDVVYLQAGQIISIWVYHTASTPMNLIPGAEKLYVSIHKVS
jgi:hypothetical protein